MSAPRRIAVIGNGGGGKTTLSRRLHELYGLPLSHVDSIQFLAGMKVRDREETARILDEIAAGPRWVIDGFGSIATMEKRFMIADKVVFVDFPLWRHYWWCTKRQLKSYWSPRSELPEGCEEAGLVKTWGLYKTLWRVHTQIRPQLLDIFRREDVREKMVVVNSLAGWRRVFAKGLD